MSKTRKPNEPFMRTNYYALLLDKSGSIRDHGLTHATLAAFNGTLTALRDGAAADRQPTTAAVLTFADAVQVQQAPADVHFIRNLDESDYRPSGMTALFDAIGDGVATVSRFGHNDPDPAYVVMVFTDGEDTLSRRSNAVMVRKLIEDKTTTGKWTFAFMVPSAGYRNRLIQTFGIPEENIGVWELSDVGTRQMGEDAAAGVGAFFRGRTAGQTQSKAFYQKVTTDLSSVAPKDFTSLPDVSGGFKSYTVAKEMQIRAFVEAHNQKFLVGAAYYQLTKPEKVAGHKAVVIAEKGKHGRVVGGEGARRLIGLPTDGQTTARVTPGNHAGFDIFVQSTSFNRLLVRGTRLLLDTTLTTELTPTWTPDPTKVK